MPNDQYNKAAKSIRNAFGAPDQDPPPPPAPPVDDGSEDESQMTFPQRVAAQLKKLRNRGAPAPASAANSSGMGASLDDTEDKY